MIEELHRQDHSGKKETEAEIAKRFLLMDGDFYTPQHFGFKDMSELMMHRAYYTGLYGDHIYNTYKIKEVKNG